MNFYIQQAKVRVLLLSRQDVVTHLAQNYLTYSEIFRCAKPVQVLSVNRANDQRVLVSRLKNDASHVIMILVLQTKPYSLRNQRGCYIGSKFHWFPPTSPGTFSNTEEDPFQSRPVQTRSITMKHPPR